MGQKVLVLPRGRSQVIRLPISIPPRELAGLIAAHHQMQVIGLDVDGVLAPIVEHADLAQLLPGISEVLQDVAQLTPTAVISGRALGDLDRLYRFPAEVEVIGSHGLESRLHPEIQLCQEEEQLLQQMRILAQQAAERAGSGAWVEHKPASVVLHTRSAAPQSSEVAITALLTQVATLQGAHVKKGHEVVELMARPTSKAAAMTDLRERHHAHCMVFFGDDLTDEEVFATFGANDISVRVGDGPTSARYHLTDPIEVFETLRHLLELLSTHSLTAYQSEP
jgi:trehalose 6-phosphate phosphatase